MTSDESSHPQMFRHPFYSFEGTISWPPERWREAKCNYCAHSFDRPVGSDGERRWVQPVPMASFHDKRSNEWRVSGIFCSWNCAKAELIQGQGYACGGGALLLDRLARTVFGYRGCEIVPAPPKTRLTFFYPGKDSLSIDEFRVESLENFTTVLHPPLLSTPEIYERHALVSSTQNWSVKGIRAGGVKGFPTNLTSECAEEISDTQSMFASFVQEQGSSEMTRGSIQAKSDECGGTLLDWSQSTPSVL